MSKTSKGAIIAISIIVIIFGFLAASYNSLVKDKEEIDKQASNIDTQLQRRADLIPNLVNSVKGSMSNEQSAIDKVLESREKLINSKSMSEKANANSEVDSALKNLLVVAEAYPDLKSSSNFNTLMDELSGTENRIANARKKYNTAVNNYNSNIKTIPNCFVAKLLGYKEADYFKAKKGVDEVVQVDFK